MSLPISDLENAIRKGDHRSPNLLGPRDSIAERVRTQLGRQDQLPGFDDLLDQQARRGEMLFLIVGDGIHQSVERFATWMNDLRALPFKLGLVELPFFDTPAGEVLVVPRTLLRTKEVARHVVMIQMSDNASTRVKVDIENSVVQESGAVKISTTPQRAATPMDESRLLASVKAAPAGAAFVSELIRELKQAGFDMQETATELQFGLIGPRSGSFLPLIRLQTGGMYASHSAQIFELVGPQLISEHRRALNRLGGFYTQEVVDTPVPGFKGCLLPKYDSITTSPKDLVGELIRFRDLVSAERGDAIVG